MNAAIVLRPEPGNARTAERLEHAGIVAIRQPLFAVAPVAWTPPDPRHFEALMLTSANAVRHAGAGLDALRDLPVIAVGSATATAARAAGLRVVLTGSGDAAALLAEARRYGLTRPLHLAGRDRTGPGDTITVYASDRLPIPPGVAAGWEGRLALLHSPRAARRFAELVERDGADRAGIGVAALSPAVLHAAGSGWAVVAAAALPSDAALVALVTSLIDPAAVDGDKWHR